MQEQVVQLEATQQAVHTEKRVIEVPTPDPDFEQPVRKVKPNKHYAHESKTRRKQAAKSRKINRGKK